MQEAVEGIYDELQQKRYREEFEDSLVPQFHIVEETVDGGVLHNNNRVKVVSVPWNDEKLPPTVANVLTSIGGRVVAMALNKEGFGTWTVEKKVRPKKSKAKKDEEQDAAMALFPSSK